MRIENTDQHTSNSDPRDLKEALEQLQLAQQRVDSVRQRIDNRGRSAIMQAVPTVRNTSESAARRRVHPLARYVVEDYVRVKNPKLD